MSRKSKKSRAGRPPTPSAAAGAPPVDQALAALFRRNVRAVVFLFVRLVALALLTTLLALQVPWVARNRLFMDAAASLLAILPFFTALGRSFGWRIALGRAYVREGRWPEAGRALQPFARASFHPFDARGEGAFHLALALRALDRHDEARRLLQRIARDRRGQWHEKAKAELAAFSPAASP